DCAWRALPDGVAGLVETPAFYPYLSGRTNLKLLARLDNGARSGRAVDRVLEQAGLATDAHIAVAGYSTGMRLRLGLASALLRSPRLLLLDEPTNALDPVGARAVRRLVRQLAASGTAVLLSSHDMAEVEALCDCLTVIDRGRVVFCGTVDALRALSPAASYALRTSDDAAALGIAARRPGVSVTRNGDGSLDVSANLEFLDGYIVALGRAGIAVRAFERRTRTLESLFLDLTRQ